MVEHALQREGPGPRRGIQAHREHRRAADTGGRRDQVGAHHIAQRNLVGGQACRQCHARVERIGQRCVRTGVEQARHRARRRQRRTGHIARLRQRDAVGKAVLVHRAGGGTLCCFRYVINDRRCKRSGRCVAIIVCQGECKIFENVILAVPVRMGFIVRKRISVANCATGYRAGETGDRKNIAERRRDDDWRCAAVEKIGERND